MTVTITRKLEIDAGHRLLKHESKCRNVHGHRYVFQVTCTAKELDGVGRVIDFSVIKSKLGGWLDENWDHGFIYEKGDPLEEFLVMHDQRCYPMYQPPTAENLAMHFLRIARELMKPHDIQVTKVVVWETPNCYATAE
jgi:6-pyruvoyltetrahydropterin/6-carboxytetrahydropterin synthase